MSDSEKSQPAVSRPKAKRGGLGRGLESLISSSPRLPEPPPTNDNDTDLKRIPINKIQPNPWQPRLHVNQEQLEELAASIRTHGLMQPLVVTEPGEDGLYTLIAGERRWRATRLAGLDDAPVVIMSATPQEMLELAIVENVVRADLSPLEEAHAYRRLIDDFSLTQSDVAERVGKSRVAITNTLRLLNAPEQVQQAIVDGEITEGHARAMLGLSSIADQLELLDQVRMKSLNVRQTEGQVRSWAKKLVRPESDPKAYDAEQMRVEGRLRDALGTRVVLRPGPGSGGKIVIDYGSEEQLQAISNRLLDEDLW